jgi:hypothetical protein
MISSGSTGAGAAPRRAVLGVARPRRATYSLAVAKATRRRRGRRGSRARSRGGFCRCRAEPKRTTLSLAARKSGWPRWRTSIFFTEPWKLKSNSSSVFLAGTRPDPRLARVRRGRRPRSEAAPRRNARTTTPRPGLARPGWAATVRAAGSRPPARPGCSRALVCSSAVIVRWRASERTCGRRTRRCGAPPPAARAGRRAARHGGRPGAGRATSCSS